VAAAAATPAAVLGLDGEIGAIRRGLRADLLALDRNWQLLRVLRDGEWVG
jgi:N-acetylglucosamine-6-phosphate deacetylase